MKTTQKIVTAGMLIAVGVLIGANFYIPVGIAKAFPIQHLINVLSAVLLGPTYAVMCAFCISLLRNLMGTGSLLAFPGSMIGALLAGLLFAKTQRYIFASIGEFIGTGIIGSLAAYPIAKLFLGVDQGIFYFVIPFSISSIFGAVIGFLMLKSLLSRLLVSHSIKHSSKS